MKRRHMELMICGSYGADMWSSNVSIRFGLVLHKVWTTIARSKERFGIGA